MALFRFHKGGLQESLDTTVIVKDVMTLMEIIRNRHKDFTGEENHQFGVVIGPYPDCDNNFDKRIGWYTQMVTSDILERGVFTPEGFLSEPI